MQCLPPFLPNHYHFWPLVSTLYLTSEVMSFYFGCTERQSNSIVINGLLEAHVLKPLEILSTVRDVLDNNSESKRLIRLYQASCEFLLLEPWYNNRPIQSMGSVNLVVIVESVHSLISKEGDELAPFHLPSIVAVAAALGTFPLLHCPLSLKFIFSRKIPAFRIQLLVEKILESGSSVVARPQERPLDECIR